jgi:ABC-2 type transport system permease protein
MLKSAQRLAALIQKETIQVLRDRRTLAIMVTMPVVVLFLFAWVAHLNEQHLPTVVADQSQDEQSRAFLAALVDSHYFDISYYVADQAAVMQAIDEGRATAGIVVPPDLDAQVARGEGQVLVILDGSDSLAVSSGYGAAAAVADDRSLALAAEQAQRLGQNLVTTPIVTSTRVLYNPDQSDLIFVVPALIGLVMQVLSTTTTSASMVREWELGTIEQLLVTPARPLERLVAKLLPNFAFMLVVLAIDTLAGVFFFRVPFRGDPGLFALLAMLFVIAGLGQGLLVSAVARTQRQAQQLSMMLMMFSVLLSGFIYPRSSMPFVERLVGNLIPLTYFIPIARGIFTKGIGLSFLWTDVAALVIYVVVSMALAALTTKNRLE